MVTKAHMDDFVKLRMNGVPAGARKLYVTFEACKRVAASGLLVAIPGINGLAHMKETLAQVTEAGMGAHIGASYYTRS